MFKCLMCTSLLVALFSHVPANGDGSIDKHIENEMFQLGLTKNATKSKRESEACVTSNGQTGECTRYYLCEGGVVNTDGVGVIDLRMGEEEDSCSSYLDECCMLPDMRDKDDPIMPRLSERQGCGWRNPEGIGIKITGNGNNEAEFGEFPWMVAILMLQPMNNYQSATLNYIGGGSLIHPGVVLTAAHILGTAALRVRAGEWDTQTEGELYPYQERNVAEVDIHESFNKANVYYDAALLFMSEPFDLAPNVGLACIPIIGEHLNLNDECFATGWGKDKFGQAGQYQNILKKIDLRLVDHDFCETQLRTTRLHKHFKLHTSFLCAGGEPDKDMCTGDGGSPLVCPVQSEANRYKQVGIVAWGIACGQAGIPAVYADVTSIGSWIDRRLSLRGYDISVYRY